RIFFALFSSASAPDPQPSGGQSLISVIPGHGVGVGFLCCALADETQTNTLRRIIDNRFIGFTDVMRKIRREVTWVYFPSLFFSEIYLRKFVKIFRDSEQLRAQVATVTIAGRG